MLWRHVFALETCVCPGDMCLLWRHGICCVDMGHVFLWEKNMSACWRRIYGVFLLEKNICCLLVGEECMDMEDVFLLDKSI